MTDHEINMAFREWSWLREGDPIGYMQAHVAARIAFKAGAEWAQKQPRAAEQPAPNPKLCPHGIEGWRFCSTCNSD